MDYEKELENFLDKDLQPITNGTKNKILHVAIDHFSQRGYRGVSIRQITRDVGIKESSLYKHFQNKDEILDTIFANFEVEVVKILPSSEQIEVVATSMDIRDFLERGLQNFVNHIENVSMRKIWRIIYNELFSDQRARTIYFETIINLTIERVGAIFEQMMRLGKLPRQDARMLSAEYHYPVFSLIMEYNFLKLEGKSTKDTEKRLQDHIDFFIKAVTN
ncbi:TetR/AcrR family transcriptional regulator [Neobacillus notoginsengisoli]|uniref:TetR/AcrR family transcriptional regulator n=1 Tax=Neobacillus notoginsengisoli TaxID=1578198 RepID=A0A417YWS4_9BACI|nr:TetR/AcrR family transcriptional regulator [Neobacillus notoginsengisoli]RHW42024.1 TetR/AcrR family transcriptional regulator [Neobacillus notoginsengisoli]